MGVAESGEPYTAATIPCSVEVTRSATFWANGTETVLGELGELLDVQIAHEDDGVMPTLD